MAKDTHLDLRLDEQTKAHISYAAKLSGDASLSHFVLAAATAAADKVLARADYTIMPAMQFDELLASLDTPDEAPRLARLFRQE